MKPTDIFLDKLDRRRRHLEQVPPQCFHRAHLRFWDWLEEEALASPTFLYFRTEYNDKKHRKSAESIARDSRDWEGALPKTHGEMLARCWGMIRVLRRSKAERYYSERTAAKRFRTFSGQDGSQEQLEQKLQRDFLTIFVDPLLDEIRYGVTRHALVATAMESYRARCERFDRERLNELADEGSNQQTENRLARHFYRYLFDRDIRCSVEPRQNAGRPDLVAYDEEEEFVVEAKVYRDSTNTSDVGDWFGQLHGYAKEKGAPRGFLLIFSRPEEELDIAVDETYLGLPTVTFQGRPYTFLIVDMYPDYETASKRGRPTGIRVERSELIDLFEGDLGDDASH